MPTSDKHISIASNVSTEDDLDYSYLKQKGIEYIEKLGGDIWTDFNAHDPGITTLELLAYTITDLGLRINQPIEDILSNDARSISPLEDQFFMAEEILPSKPVTAIDYRKLFVDIDGVKNAWIIPFKKKVFVNRKDNQLSYTSFKIEDEYKDDFDLKGLYHVFVDFDELDGKHDETVKQKERILEEVAAAYHQNRNLCEDLVYVHQVHVHPIAVCAKIDIHAEADEELVHAKVLRAINEYLSPEVNFYSLQEMFDKGYKSTDIFDGPILKNGFIDSNELRKSELTKEIRLSDIIRIIMDIEEVNLIHDISIGNCGDDENLTDKVWVMQVEAGSKPILCDKSKYKYSYTKGLLPVNLNKDKVEAHLSAFANEEREQKKHTSLFNKLTIPLGDDLNIGEYSSFQNSFPENYGIGETGLSSKETPQRKAQAKQLQAYLLFFDQILASYFAQLQKAKDLLSVNQSEDNSYFTQAVADIQGIENLIPEEYLQKSVKELSDFLFSDLDNKKARKNQLLDHLLARFAENFGKYAFLMKQLYGAYAEDEVIKAKQAFLHNYNTIGTERGSAFNYKAGKKNIWDTSNLASVVKRVSLLAGITNHTRRNLSGDPLEIYQENDDDRLLEYRWRIWDKGKIVLTGSKKYLTLEELFCEVLLVKELSKNPDNYSRELTKSDKYYFNLVNPAYDKKDEAYIIARRVEYFNTEEAMEAAIDHVATYMQSVETNEGMYLVEHMLLRPDHTKTYEITHESFLPVCNKLDDECITDPYSFRLTIILPGWTERFANAEFRAFLEDLIRKELPAHILARICWIGYPATTKSEKGENDMVAFETAWKAFLETIDDSSQPISAVINLREIMCRLNTIYPNAVLHDCEKEDEKIKGKIILGKTNLGNIYNS